jgi:hypothetical protein
VHSGLLQGIEIIQKAEEWRVGIGGREGIVEGNRNIDEKALCVLSIASWAVRHAVTTKGHGAAFVNVIDVLRDSHADASTAVKVME